MALDSRNKRGSSIGIGLILLLPLADGAIDQGDRQQTAHTYRGILAGAPVATVDCSLDISALIDAGDVNIRSRIDPTDLNVSAQITDNLSVSAEIDDDDLNVRSRIGPTDLNVSSQLCC